MNDPAYCPVALEQGLGPNSAVKAPFDGRMTWSLDLNDPKRGDRVCSFCGGLHPDDLMWRLEGGDAMLTPTDKAYKVYVEHLYDPRLAKFYFQHLSRVQQVRFGELLAKGRLKLRSPGHFYVTPFFLPQPGATQS